MNKNKTSIWIMLAVLFTTILTASAQILWKIGTNESIPNIYILIGFILYGIGALILIMSLKKGELSVLYPIIAMSYVWVALFAPMFIKTESMNLFKWIGIGLIVLGVSLIGIGSRGEK